MKLSARLSIPADFKELDVDGMVNEVTTAMHKASKRIPSRAVTANRPWISSRTLKLVERRNAARSNSNHALEVQLHRQVPAAAKRERREWIDDMLKSGEWDQVRRLRRVPRAKQ